MIVLAFRFQEIDFCASYCSKPPPAQVSLECEGPQVCLSFQFGGKLILFCFSDLRILQSLISGRSDKQQGDVWPSDWLREKEIVMFSDIDQALIKWSPYSVETCDQFSLPCALTAFKDQIEVSWNDKKCFEQYTHRWWFVARKRRWALLKLGWRGSWGHTVPIQTRQVYYSMSVSALRGGKRE